MPRILVLLAVVNVIEQKDLCRVVMCHCGVGDRSRNNEKFPRRVATLGAFASTNFQADDHDEIAVRIFQWDAAICVRECLAFHLHPTRAMILAVACDKIIAGCMEISLVGFDAADEQFPEN